MVDGIDPLNELSIVNEKKEIREKAMENVKEKCMENVINELMERKEKAKLGGGPEKNC